MIAAPSHTAAAVALARQLHDGGWGVAEIRAYLAKRGIDVHHSTVYRWTNEAYAERSRRAKRIATNRNRQRAGGRLGVDRHSDEFRLERMIGLRATGMSCSAIAKAMTFDWPDDPMNEHRVRYLLGRLS